MQKSIKKIIHISVIVVIIVLLMFTALMIILKYGEDGETNMPFDVSKISIISTIDAQDVEEDGENFNLEVSQNNDIYIYIEKNENYKKTETIETVVIDNITVTEEPEVGEIISYKPSQNATSIFENADDYKTSEISFTGEQSTDIQNLQISNQGGIIAFRCSNVNLDTYTSSDEEIDYSELLKKLGVENEDLKATISFDVTIKLNSGKSFKAEFSVDIPVDDVVEDGETSLEITDLQESVFKRIEN